MIHFIIRQIFKDIINILYMLSFTYLVKVHKSVHFYLKFIYFKGSLKHCKVFLYFLIFVPNQITSHKLGHRKYL